MKIVSYIQRCLDDVNELILHHGGLWQGPIQTRAAPRGPPQSTVRATPQHDVQFVPDPEYQQAECFESDGRQSPTEGTGELKLVLDPDFL
jgi:hypothetical protein